MFFFFFLDFMMLQELLGSSKHFVILHWQPFVFWDSFQPKCFDGQGWIILALQVVWNCGKNGYDGWKSTLPACCRHPGIALCGHAGCGDVGTVVGVINLVLKSSTKFSFYTDAWIYRVGLVFFPFKFPYLSSPAISQSMPVNMYCLNR